MWSVHFDVFFLMHQILLTFVLVTILKHEVEQFEIAIDNPWFFGRNHRILLIDIDQKGLNHVKFD